MSETQPHRNVSSGSNPAGGTSEAIFQPSRPRSIVYSSLMAVAGLHTQSFKIRCGRPMNLNGDDLRAAYYCVSEIVRSRRRTGAPIPGWLRRHYNQLDAAIRVSGRGHKNSCDTAQSDTLSTMQVAKLLRRNER
jgi:hypothetical protein